MIAEIRPHIPYITLLTNGTLLDEDRDDFLLESGIHTLKIGCVWHLNEHLPLEMREKRLNGLERSVDRISRKTKSRGRTHPKLACIIPIHGASFPRTEPLMRRFMQAGCDGIYYTLFKSYGAALDPHGMQSSDIEALQRLFAAWRPEMHRRGMEHKMASAQLAGIAVMRRCMT